MSLESLLEKITDSKLHDEDWKSIESFCMVVKRGKESPVGVLQMILDRLRSTNVVVATHALSLLEAVVKNCGLEIHSQIGKFRFLNELIKLVSPKYCANTPTEIVQRILVDIEYWSLNIPDQAKITEAYHMLVRQGVVFPQQHYPTMDRIPAGEGFMDVPLLSPRVSPLEQDTKKAELLARLLKSKDPKDLIKANRLIKRLADQHDKKLETNAKTSNELEVAENNAKLLSDMLTHYSIESDPRLEENEIVQDLYKACLASQPKLSKLATESDGKNDLLGEIIRVNDGLTSVIEMYRQVEQSQNAFLSRNHSSGFNSATVFASAAPAPSQQATRNTSSLLDLDFSPRSGPVAPVQQQLAGLSFAAPTQQPLQPQNLQTKPKTQSLLDDDLLGGFSTTSSSSTASFASFPAAQPSHSIPAAQPSLFSSAPAQQSLFSSAPAQSSQSLFGAPAAQPLFPQPTQTFAQPSFAQPPLSFGQPQPSFAQPLQPQPVLAAQPAPLLAGFGVPQPAVAPAILTPTSAPLQLVPGISSSQAPNLASINIPISSIRPSERPPIDVYNKNNVRVMFHVAKDTPHPSLVVVVASYINLGSFECSDLSFQVAVPKTQQVKLQPPSGTNLPALDPTRPPGTVTQIMIISNPTNTQIRIRYKIKFTVGGMVVDDVGEASI
eukprot:m.54015 g.54015  ORF g.54015 m.54015 type:complete len:665 (+) comp48684_c0_seq2:98-2092(+)